MKSIGQLLQNILKPGGKWLGMAGSRGVQRVTEEQINSLATDLGKLGTIISKPAYVGTMYEMDV